MIISPISYPGNKSKILKQLIPELDTNVSNFVDVFAGSGVVAVNTKYQNLYCNDILECSNDYSADTLFV